MPDFVKPAYIVLLLFFVVPGSIGGILATNRGRNVIGWSLLCAVFPIFLLAIYFKKPIREVEGKFKRCGACHEYLPWKDETCKYCSAPQPPRG
jgi:hypothetical protein